MLDAIDAAALDTVAGSLAAAGVWEIRVTGGEPTQHPGLLPLIERLHALGFYLSMGTNGVFGPALRERLLASPLDWYILDYYSR